MRVITGSARGRKLKTPENYDVRPTTDNVKESVFNIIHFDIAGRRVLDLFAGTGQMGIEALSRGAAEAVFVDSSEKSLKMVRENLAICNFSSPVIRADALDFVSSCGKFDIIFIDPPYDSGIYEEILAKINSVDILSEGGIIIVEARRECVLPELQEPYLKAKEYRYGKIKIAKYVKSAQQ